MVGVAGAAPELEPLLDCDWSLVLGVALDPPLDWPLIGALLEDELAPELGVEGVAEELDELESVLGADGVAEELELDESFLLISTFAEPEEDDAGGVLVPAEDDDEFDGVDGVDGVGVAVLDEDEEPADGVRVFGPSAPLSQPYRPPTAIAIGTMTKADFLRILMVAPENDGG